MFLRDFAYLKNITAGASKLLLGLIPMIDGNNEITLNKAHKRKIAESTGLAENSINVLLKQLKDKGILISIDRGIYQLNPCLFSKSKRKWKKKCE